MAVSREAPLLAVTDLHVRHGPPWAENHSVVGATFSVWPGEIVGIIGESGSGKSSAALACFGLVRGGGRIAAGSIQLFGQELLGLDEAGWRRIRGARIGFVAQDPRGALNPVLRVGEQIANVYRAHRRVDGARARHRAIALLARLGFNDPERRVDAYPHELSGGMAQRVVIAMALACEPDLVVADEPTSGLDPTVQAQILDDLAGVVSETRSSLVLVTHDPGIIANYCRRTYLFDAGEVVLECDVSTLFSAPGHPAAMQLLGSIAGKGRELARFRGGALDRLVLPSGCFAHNRCPFAEQASGCHTEHPELIELAPGHRSRCHRREAVRRFWEGKELETEPQRAS